MEKRPSGNPKFVLNKLDVKLSAHMASIEKDQVATTKSRKKNTV